MFISTWTLRVVQVVHWLGYKIFIQRVLGFILIIIVTTKHSPFFCTSHKPSTCLCVLSLYILFVYLGLSPPHVLSFQWSLTEQLNLQRCTIRSYKNVPCSFSISLCIQQRKNLQNTFNKI